MISSIKFNVETDRVTLNYRFRNGGNNWLDANYNVLLDRTSCNLGGERTWFFCPVPNCQKRVAILYGGNIFACRHCYQLAYESQRENFGDRATKKADKIRDRLCWEPGILNGDGWKPKGMHWKTFERLCILHNESVNLSLNEAVSRFGINPFDL